MGEKIIDIIGEDYQLTLEIEVLKERSATILARF
ncbi:hypothetical protein [Ligilactobacillus agilis]